MQLAGKFFDPESFDITPKRFAESNRNDNFELDIKDSGITKEQFQIKASFEKTDYHFFRDLLMKKVSFSYDDVSKNVYITKIEPKFMAGFAEITFTLEEV